MECKLKIQRLFLIRLISSLNGKFWPQKSVASPYTVRVVVDIRDERDIRNIQTSELDKPVKYKTALLKSSPKC